MAALSEYEDAENETKTPAMNPFNAALDPSEENRKTKNVTIEGDGKAEEEVLPSPSPSPVTKVEEEKDALRAPNKGNGLDMGHYSWGQTSEDVNIKIPVPFGTMARDITCEIREDRIKFGLKGQPPVLDGELCKPINYIHSFWVVDDKNPVSICLIKQDTTQKDWWNYIVKGEPEIDIQKVRPEETNVDPEARAAFEKMVRENMLKKLMAKYPGMTIRF